MQEFVSRGCGGETAQNSGQERNDHIATSKYLLTGKEVSPDGAVSHGQAPEGP